MLQFFMMILKSREINVRFQYILCYSSSKDYVVDIDQVSIFQYILCYSSSCFCPISSVKKKYFNTSYVTVLPVLSDELITYYTFQYILCYSSSHLGFDIILVSQLFQYILCYSSSRL